MSLNLGRSRHKLRKRVSFARDPRYPILARTKIRSLGRTFGGHGIHSLSDTTRKETSERTDRKEKNRR